MPSEIPLVSICIPTYNAEKFIAETIQSALAQTYPNLEIIIADDGSTDGTLEIANGWLDAEEDEDGESNRLGYVRENRPISIKVFAHENLGIGRNWNFCLNKASGKYIKFLFQDDLLEPTCVEKMVALAETDAAIGMVFSRRHILLSDDTSFDSAYIDITSTWTKLENIQHGHALLADPNLLLTPLNKIGEPSNVLIKAEVFSKVGEFDATLAQVLDLDMWLRIMSYYKVGYIDEALATFRVHKQQQSQLNIQTGAAWLDDWRLYFKMLGDSNYQSLPISLRTKLIEVCSTRIRSTYKDLESLRTQTITAYQEVQNVQAQMQSVYDELNDFQSKYWRMNEELNLTATRLEEAQGKITAMESSKFWKLRNAWLKLKAKLGLPAQD